MNYEYKKASDLINDLISIAEFGPRVVSSDHFRFFAFGNDSISIIGFEKFEEYLEKLESIYALNKEINTTYSLKRFEEKIIDLIRLVRAQKRETTPDDVEQLFGQLLGVESVEFEIFRELFGGKLNIPQIDFGDFTIYNVELSKPALLQKYTVPETHEKLYFDKVNSNLLISIRAIAREKDKAIEIADLYFKSFDNAMSYVLADLSHKFTVGIFNFRGYKLHSALACSKKYWRSKHG